MIKVQREESKFRKILQSKQRIKYYSLKFVLAGHIVTKENT